MEQHNIKEDQEGSSLPYYLAWLLVGPLSLGSPEAGAHAAVMEKCYGGALRGQNDCRTAIHHCAGLAVRDGDPEDWNYVPTGQCTKIRVQGETSAMHSTEPLRDGESS